MPLVVENVAKSYGSITALRGVDLEISKGEVVALLGPNGAGKTTLVSIVAGLRAPDSGRVRVQGIDILEEPERARCHLGIAPQQTGVYPVLSVYENLYFFGALGGLGRAPLKRRIEEASEAFELLPLLDRPARFLSGGEARRLHTAMALMHDPSLLLLDEPTAGVDVRTRSRLLGVVRGLAERGSAVCYSTHYLGEVEELNASVAILDRGRIIARDSLPALLRRHGKAAIEMRFDAAPPALPIPGAVASGPRLRIPTDGPPTEQVGEILAALGNAAREVRSIEFVEPDLESVFLALTGRTFVADGDGAGNVPA
jgi:ABC-2 type transport system ATP-binding protein